MSVKDRRYLQDTSALFAITDNETGADAGQKVLEDARKGRSGKERDPDVAFAFFAVQS